MERKAGMTLTVAWSAPTWWSLFRYREGTVTRLQGPGTMASVTIDRLYKHTGTGQLSLYSADALDGLWVQVNDEPLVILRRRGRFGRLYRSYYS